jgi:hypothetical protein
LGAGGGHWAAEVGQIAARTHADPAAAGASRRLVRILLSVAVGLVAITVGLGFWRGNPAGENILAGVAAAIAAIPEEPPILLAVILGLGAYRLLRRDILVRRLNAQETLGAVDFILTDKTGTLTLNRLSVAAVRTPDGPIGRPRILGERAAKRAWQAVRTGELGRARSVMRWSTRISSRSWIRRPCSTRRRPPTGGRTRRRGAMTRRDSATSPSEHRRPCSTWCARPWSEAPDRDRRLQRLIADEADRVAACWSAKTRAPIWPTAALVFADPPAPRSPMRSQQPVRRHPVVMGPATTRLRPAIARQRTACRRCSSPAPIQRS